MKFINFDDIVNKNNENYINKNVFVPQHVSNTIIIGQTWMFKNKPIIQYFNIESSFSKNFYFYKRT